MTICVLQYDDRSDAVLGDQRRLAKSNERMSFNDGANYFFDRSSNGQYPPYWQKVASARELMDDEKCDAVMFRIRMQSCVNLRRLLSRNSMENRL